MNSEALSILNVDLNIKLLLHNILPLEEYDVLMANYIRESPGSAQEKVVAFLTDFLQKAIFQKQLQALTQE